MIRIGIAGGAGRMGRMNIASTIADTRFTLTSVLEAEGNPYVGRSVRDALAHESDVVITSDANAFLAACDVVIDFTLPHASMALLPLAAEMGKHYVLATTGLSQKEKNAVADYAKRIPIVFAPNMSVGVNVLLRLVKEAATLLGDAYEIEIVEAHHNKKKDAPSGTALRLAEVAAEALSRNLDECGVYGREGAVGERTKKEIGVHAVRAGDIVGEHTVTFCSEGERVELTHKAHSRMNFSKGSLEAAAWLADKTSGLYSMQDVLGLS